VPNATKTPQGVALTATLYPAPLAVGEEPDPELVPEPVLVVAVAAGSVALLIEVVAATLTVGVPFSTVK
jgi:hypothetical protein